MTSEEAAGEDIEEKVAVVSDERPAMPSAEPEEAEGSKADIRAEVDDSILFRRFRAGDLEDALDLDREVFGGYDPTIFRAFYEYHPHTTLVAESRSRVIGFVLGFKHTAMEGRIFWLAVRPGYQNRGVGRRLLTKILSTFRLMGSASATLEVRVSNKRAQALYSSMGFRMASIYPGYYSDGEAAIIMRKYY